MDRAHFRRLRTLAISLASANDPDAALGYARQIGGIVLRMARPSRAKIDANYAGNYSDPIPAAGPALRSTSIIAPSNEGAKSDKVRVDDLDRRLQLAFTSDGSKVDKPAPDAAVGHRNSPGCASEIAPRPLPDSAELHIGSAPAVSPAVSSPPMPVDIKVNTTATVPRRGLRFDTTKALPRTRLPAFDFRAPKRTSTTGPPERRKPEDDAIALFIAEKGVSKCPDAMPGAGDLGELEFDQQTRKWRRNPPPVDTSPAQVD